MLAELKIAQLRHFVWVAELKGFHAAAAKAHRTQPAISLSIRDLENKLGEGLFEKRNAKTAKTELTPFGLHFLPQAKELIAHHDRIAEDMALLVQHKTGHLRLAVVPSVASRMLPSILQRFMANTPDLHLSIFDASSDTVLEMVESRQVDFGIASLWEAQSDKTFIPVWEDRVGVVCHRDHPLAGETHLNWKQLRGHRQISNGTTRLLANSDAEELIDSAQFYISNMISLIAMLDVDMGITTLPWFAFPQDNPNLKFIPLADPEVVRQIGILSQAQRSLTPPAQALVDFILTTEGKLAPPERQQ